MGNENCLKSAENVMANQELEKKDAVQPISDEEAEDALGGGYFYFGSYTLTLKDYSR